MSIPETLRICDRCGDIAETQSCATCERFADQYEARYHSYRAAALYFSLPRQAAAMDDDGLGAWRGMWVVFKIYLVASTVIGLAGFLWGLLA